MGFKNLLLCLGFALALPVGQVMFKWAALHHAALQGPLLLRMVSNLPLWMAFAWYGSSSILWFFILTRVPLSLAYPVAILGAGLVPVLSWYFFREPLSWRLGAGYALMLAGMVIIQKPAG